MSAPLLLALGLLGGAGAVARVVVDSAVSARVRRGPGFGILAVNLSGAFALGIVIGAALHGDALRLVATGLLGSYTTFSTWMLESQRLGEGDRRAAALLNVIGSLALGLLVVWLGRRLGMAL